MEFIINTTFLSCGYRLSLEPVYGSTCAQRSLVARKFMNAFNVCHLTWRTTFCRTNIPLSPFILDTYSNFVTVCKLITKIYDALHKNIFFLIIRSCSSSISLKVETKGTVAVFANIIIGRIFMAKIALTTFIHFLILCVVFFARFYILLLIIYC